MKNSIASSWRAIREFIHLESAGGYFLFFAAALALIIDNTPLSDYYHAIFQMPITMMIAGNTISTTITFLINDVLMAFFFLLVSLEIKREILVGELNSLNKISLPIISALGGMLIPALIYILFNSKDTIALRGWAIPTATDIAFALGVITLLSKRVPRALKVFLMALAIFDDLGAIIIIAVFYNTHLSWLALILAGICFLILIIINYLQIFRLTAYLILGCLLWFCLLFSGIHPTLAGVLLAFTIPLGVDNQKTSTMHAKNFYSGKQKQPLLELEHKLHPWVAYGIVPIFGFANAGISFFHSSLTQLFSPVALGIMAGLFLGKQLGVFIAAWLAVKLRLAVLPLNTNWRGIYGVALLCGIGFTMSLFIGALAFADDGVYTISVRFAVLVASLLSGFLGYLLLRTL